MAISADQQATLQLLLERGQTYSDLARLLREDESQVRARARTALAELGGADPDRNVGLTDYLLGQADPIGRADASRHLRDSPEDHRLARELSSSLRSLFPEAQLPRLPGEPRPARRLERREPRIPALSGLSKTQSRLIVAAASAGILLLVVVLAVAGAFSGTDKDIPVSTATTASTSGTDQEIERVPLRPVGNGDASGEAVFGLADSDQPFVELAINGLDPAPSGRTYVVWLMLNEAEGYPLSPITVTQTGDFSDRYSIPSTILPLIARVRFVDVSIAPVKTIRHLVRTAIEDTALILPEPGDVVLRGTVSQRGKPNDAGKGATDEG